MSLAAISKALESHLKAMTPALDTAWENVSHTPMGGVPYQAAFFLPARPNDYAVADGHQEIGLFQINLRYPLKQGRADVLARAEAIRAHFAKNMTLPVGQPMAVKIMRTAEIAPGFVDGDRYVVPVTIRWSDK